MYFYGKFQEEDFEKYIENRFYDMLILLSVMKYLFGLKQGLRVMNKIYKFYLLFKMVSFCNFLVYVIFMML